MIMTSLRLTCNVEVSLEHEMLSCLVLASSKKSPNAPVSERDIHHLSILLRRRIGILLAELIPQIPILATESLTLFLQRLDIPLLLRQLVLQFANLARVAGLGEFVGFLARGFGVAFVAFDFFFEAEGVEYHDVGAVQDEGEEEGEAAEVHVALGVEFAGLDFHAAGAFEHGGAGLTNRSVMMKVRACAWFETYF